MEIFSGGHIYVDQNDGDCTNPKFDTSNPISFYGGIVDGNKATFITNGEVDKWSGDLFIVQGDTDSTEISRLSVGQRQFRVLQKTTKCVAAPSMSPSTLPTNLPSYSSIPSKFPTRDPSPSPSSIPSLKPSTLPSNIHSSLPSLSPLALPSDACPYDGFLGRTFKSVVHNECWIFECYPGGKMKVDHTDSTCSKNTPDSSAYVLSQYKQGLSNRLFFERIPDATESTWEVYISVIEDAELTQETLLLTKFGWNSNKLIVMLKVPDCPSSEPSEKPSSNPSGMPSSSPTSNDQFSTYSSLPNASPSGKPSITPLIYCVDNPLNWYDSDGPKFTCSWYADKDNCAHYGQKYRNDGYVADEACCVCGGGNQSSSKSSSSASSTQGIPVAPSTFWTR
jgi:hypothetical protein